MGKKYFCWLSPDGKPCIKEDKFAPVALLTKYGESAKLADNGGLTFSGLGFEQLETAIIACSVIITPEETELNEDDSSAIITKALRESCKELKGGKAIPANIFRKYADNLAADFFRKSAKEYYLVCSISVKELPASPISICGCTISRLADRKSIPIPKPILDSSPTSLIRTHIETTHYKWIKIETSGRSIYEAAERALQSVSQLIGLWTLITTYGRFSIRFGNVGNSKPLGAITTGPVHSLHEMNGSLANENVFWRNKRIDEDLGIFHHTPWKDVEDRRKSLCKKLDRLPYRAEMGQIIARYTEAMEQPEHEIAFLKLWSLLEKITDSIGDYEKTIERGSWFMANRSVSRNLLSAMRVYRNRYVHSSMQKCEPEQAAYIIKGYVDIHILNLIQNRYKIERMEDYAKLLSLPVDLGALKRQLKAIKAALLVHGPRK